MEEMYEMGNEMKLEMMEIKLRQVERLLEEFRSSLEISQEVYQEKKETEKDSLTRSFYAGCYILTDIALSKIKSIQEDLNDECC